MKKLAALAVIVPSLFSCSTTDTVKERSVASYDDSAEIVKLSMLEEKEQALEDIDLNDTSLNFKSLSAMGGTTKKNWRIKKADEAIAGLKCTNGNTNHHAAVAAYNLGKKLHFNIYPVAIYKKVKRVITDQNATYNMDEECALKEWIDKFTQYYWNRETFGGASNKSKDQLISALSCKNSVDLNQSYYFYSESKRGNPSINDKMTIYKGTTTLKKAVSDFSNMMLIDVLVGNNDRFPGGNVFFRTESGKYTIDEAKRTVVYQDARFFSLDNEAGMKSTGSNARGDLIKFVTRFDEDMIKKLKQLKEELLLIDQKNIPDEYFYLRFPVSKGKMKAVQLVINNIDFILKHVEKQKEICGEGNIYFK